MNLDHIRTWTSALRSDAYSQVDGTLAKQIVGEEKIGYCCLGVGCVLADVPHETQTHECGDSCEDCEEGLVKHMFGTERATDLPPVEFHQWLGIATENEGNGGDVFLDWPEEYHTLTTQGPEWPYITARKAILAPSGMTCANLNDSMNLTFPQIADMIDYFGVKSA